MFALRPLQNMQMKMTLKQSQGHGLEHEMIGNKTLSQKFMG